MILNHKIVICKFEYHTEFLPLYTRQAYVIATLVLILIGTKKVI